MSKKVRYNREFLERFCQENEIKYEHIDDSVKFGRDTRVRGYCKGEKCDQMFERSIRCLITVGSYCKKCIIILTKEKIKQKKIRKIWS